MLNLVYVIESSSIQFSSHSMLAGHTLDKTNPRGNCSHKYTTNKGVKPATWRFCTVQCSNHTSPERHITGFLKYLLLRSKRRQITNRQIILQNKKGNLARFANPLTCIPLVTQTNSRVVSGTKSPLNCFKMHLLSCLWG